LTLASSIQNSGGKENPLGIPAGVGGMVVAAQFLGVTVGVLMEDEIPQGLQHIANSAGRTVLLNGEKAVQKRLMISSLFRLIVGYLFLSSLFINIAQNDDVINIFYDVLALEFVQKIDDTAFALAKRGFFGKNMLIATNKAYNLQISWSHRPALNRSGSSASERRLAFLGMIAHNNRVNRVVRLMYFLNSAIVLVGLGYITAKQNKGQYRCKTISIVFDEEIWEDAFVRLADGRYDEKLLIYTHFNGIYKENGKHEGYPRYVEQNKNNGKPYNPPVFGAEIVYCNELGSWVFRHPNITTTPNDKDENECSWLWRSPQTQDFDILSSTNGAWETWIGEVKPLTQLSINCIECSDRSYCNYHGNCGEDKTCLCDPLHYGHSCEFEYPCESLATEKAHTFDPAKGVKWEQDNPIKLIDSWDQYKAYDRPVYIQTDLSGQPFDMRLHTLLKKEITSSPSVQPSHIPSVTKVPTPIPSQFPTPMPTTVAPSHLPTLEPTTQPPSYMPSISPSAFPLPTSSLTEGSIPPIEEPTAFPTILATPTLGFDITLVPTVSAPRRPTYPPIPPGMMPPPPTQSPTPLPTKPTHTQIEYDTASDFADLDDFFERQPLHDLEDILEDYSVIISYSGSRYYGTIIESDATLDDIFPSDYHAFWSQSFNVNRTFIISEITFSSTPVGVDFFEMRRRIGAELNPNVHFSYGPYGALIPLMSYQGSGFFHCFDVTPSPSVLPSISAAPTSTASPSQTPSGNPSISIQPSTSVGPSRSQTVLFRCPPIIFVGCTAADPAQFEDECRIVGEPCDRPSEFCCRDGCPRNYCTTKALPPITFKVNRSPTVPSASSPPGQLSSTSLPQSAKNICQNITVKKQCNKNTGGECIWDALNEECVDASL